jgi:hypothetical protein
MQRGDKVDVTERRGDAPQFDAGFRARLYDLLEWRRDVLAVKPLR